MLDTIRTIQTLHKQDVHLVLCRAKDEGNKKAKAAIESRWQSKSVALKRALEHVKAGGLLGFIPGRSNIWALDIDHFPSAGKDTGELLASVETLATVDTPRGKHVYFKKASSTPMANRAWALAGFAGDVRGGTLRRNMKKRDEELQKIQLSISEIDLSISEIEQKLNTFTAYGGQPGDEGPVGPIIREWLPAERRPEVEALVNKRTDLISRRAAQERRRAALVTEGEEEARLADEHNRTQKQDCP